jgi:hypothetical protein
MPPSRTGTATPAHDTTSAPRTRDSMTCTSNSSPTMNM